MAHYGASRLPLFIVFLVAALCHFASFAAAQDCSSSTPCAEGCCSKWGFCGWGSDFCGDGCQNNCNAVQECNSDRPCKTGCCSKFGHCGFGPDYCGDGCVGNCDAKPECGQYAPSGKTNCPLGVCCSKHGFCGTTHEFCDAGECQNGCGTATRPSCSANGGSSNARTIAYYESWAYDRKCEPWAPEDIDVSLLTHLNFAFALVGPDNRIAAASPQDPALYMRATAMKRVNPSLRVYIAVGGWAAGGPPFSNMAATAGGRAAFVESVVAFIQTYGFDGIDMDWEYPSADDRGGVPADTSNYVLLLQELRAALPRRYGLTVTVPNSYWYLQHFDVVATTAAVDWINVMSYDIHGTWDGNSQWTKPEVRPHTNISEIADGLDLLWKNNVPPDKVVLGLAFYGRSFTLTDPSCTSPGCQFRGGGEPGRCSGESGILANFEIQEIIAANGLSPHFDEAAGVKWMSWNGQWVSYDDAETFAVKKRFANSLCLGGVMIWAVDQDDKLWASSLVGLSRLNPLVIYNGRDGDDAIGPQLRLKAAIDDQNNIGLVTYYTECGRFPVCAPGFRLLTTFYGSVNLADSQLARCPGPLKGRGLCIEDDVEADGCSFVGDGLFCAGCPAGSIEIGRTDDLEPYSFSGNKRPGCFPGTWASFCCRDVKAKVPPQRCDLMDYGAEIATGGMNGNLDSTAEQQQDRGDEVRSGPDEAAGRIERSGRAKALALDGGDKFGTLMECYPPLEFLIGVASLFWVIGWWRGLDFQADPVGDGSPCEITLTSFAESTATEVPWKTRTCDLGRNPQACLHYHSVGTALGIGNTLTCPYVDPGPNRQAPAQWDREHNRAWRSLVAGYPSPGDDTVPPGCERDEYPFQRFKGPPGMTSQLMRVLEGAQNGRAGQIPNGVCPRTIAVSTTTSIGPAVGRVCTAVVLRISTQTILTIEYPGLQPAWTQAAIDYRIRENGCLIPTSIVDDPGFALFTTDQWYYRNGRNGPPFNYRLPPPHSVTTRVFRMAGMDGLVVGNSSTNGTDEGELHKRWGVMRCRTPGCAREREAALAIDPAGCSSSSPSEAGATSHTTVADVLEPTQVAAEPATPRHPIAPVARQTPA